jgi:NAD(P)-dependent dehydrogenase (short-subunit alcohol dehydrogenase family)
MKEKHGGKVVLVTGGASGLGLAIVSRFALEGANVISTDLQDSVGIAAAEAIGATFLHQDVRDEAHWKAVIQQVEDRHGRLDVLVNNAGILGPTDAVSPVDTDLQAWRAVFAVNVEGVFLGCRAAIPAMRRSAAGSIINISSIAGLLATPYATAYGASKAAVRQLTKSVAQHCAEKRLNIRCNSVHPGTIRTPLLEAYAKTTAQSRGLTPEQILAEEQSCIPQGNFTLAEDVAAAVSFLASSDARHITGTKMIVDGGLVNCDTFSWTQKSSINNRSSRSSEGEGNLA